MTTPIVTKESLQAMLDNPNRTYVMHVIGRALVVLFNRQTESEKSTNDSKIFNMIGFTGADAKSGSLTAKYYLKHRKLEDWQMDKWLKRGEKSGVARLCKYHRQLNEAAEHRQNSK